jgi:hypothetical protein
MASQINGAVTFAEGLLQRRRDSLAAGQAEGYSEEFLMDIFLQITALERAVRKLHDLPPNDARHVIEEMIPDTSKDVQRDLRRVLCSLQEGIPEEDSELAQEPILALESDNTHVGQTTNLPVIEAGVTRHETTTFELLEHLYNVLQTLNAQGVKSLLVLDYDETLVSNFNTIKQLIESMIGFLPSEVNGLFNQAIQDAHLNRKESDDTTYLYPENIAILNQIAAFENVEVFVLTKRNAEGVEEVRTLFAEIGIPNIPVIGTIREDTSTVEKSVIIRGLVTQLGSQVIHYAEDSEPHRLAVVEELGNSGLEVHIHEVDLKAQVSTSAYEWVMQKFAQ